jgi:hypothetical protein
LLKSFYLEAFMAAARPVGGPAANAGWLSLVPQVPRWENIRNISCSNLIDRVIHGWQVTLILGAVVVSIMQAVTAIFSGMIGYALLSAGVACVLLFAASYVAQHHLIAETRQALAQARAQLGQIQDVAGQLNNVAMLANQNVDALGRENLRVQNAAVRLEEVVPAMRNAVALLSDPGLQLRISQAQRALADLDAQARATQARYEVSLAALQGIQKKLDNSVDRAGARFDAAAQGAQQLVAELGAVTLTIRAPDPAHPPLTRAPSSVC